MRKKALTGIAVAVFYLALWQIASALLAKELLLPSPLRVLQSLCAMAGEARFWQSVGLSLGRILGGYALGVAAGGLLAVTCYALPLLRALARPMMAVVRATPVASFIILALYFLSVGRVPAFASFLMVMPVVFASALEGLDRADPALLEMAKVFRLPRARRFFSILLPCALPYALTAAMTCLGLAWKAGVAAEVLGSPALSMGRGLRDAKTYLQTPELFAWTLVIILVSMLLEALLHRAVSLAGRGREL